MLKNSQKPPPRMSEDDAIGIGISALEHLAADPELLSRFLSITGLDPQRLRQEAAKPAFFAGLLDFVLDHEPTLDSFAADAKLDPEAVVAARDALAGAFGTTPR